MRAWIQLLNELLNSPKMILVICVICAITGTLLDGTFYRIWELKNEESKIEAKLIDTKVSLMRLKKQIKMANDPTFIEREAKERFDLVEQDDLIFIFSDEN